MLPVILHLSEWNCLLLWGLFLPYESMHYNEMILMNCEISQMWKRMWNTGILEVPQYQTMCCFVHCTDLNKEWLFLLWEWHMPLNSLFPLQFYLCTILQSSEDKHVNRVKNKKRGKKKSLFVICHCCQGRLTVRLASRCASEQGPPKCCGFCAPRLKNNSYSLLYH